MASKPSSVQESNFCVHPECGQLATIPCPNCNQVFYDCLKCLKEHAEAHSAQCATLKMNRIKLIAELDVAAASLLSIALERLPASGNILDFMPGETPQECLRDFDRHGLGEGAYAFRQAWRLAEMSLLLEKSMSDGKKAISSDGDSKTSSTSAASGKE